jgi:hypothetical protein
VGDSQTHRQDGDRISLISFLFFFFGSKGSRVNNNEEFIVRYC